MLFLFNDQYGQCWHAEIEVCPSCGQAVALDAAKALPHEAGDRWLGDTPVMDTCRCYSSRAGRSPVSDVPSSTRD